MVLGGGGYKNVYGGKFAKISLRYVWDKPNANIKS